MVKNLIKKIVQKLRRRRVYHRRVGLFLSVFVLVVSITGILLAWKKDANWIQAPTQKSKQVDIEYFKPLSAIQQVAIDTMLNLKGKAYAVVDRIDVRPSKGISKVLFKKGYWEVQVDCTTLKVLSISQRHSGWIEALHDGSIISDGFKLISMNIIGILLIFMVLTGLYLYLYPRKIRKLRKLRQK